MKTNCKKLLAILLALTVFFSCFAVSASGLSADDAWQTYYADYMAKGYAVYMNPGRNETERNFSWYTPSDAIGCKITVSETSDFAEYKTFTATAVTTPELDCTQKVTVSGLDLGKTYYYRVYTNNQIIKEASFATVAGNDFTAVYMTDIHISREEDEMVNPLIDESYTLDYVLNKAKAVKNYDLIISAGDQASYGDRQEYMSLVASPVFDSVPIALCVGNHDRKGIAYRYFNNNPNKDGLGTSSMIGADYWYVKGDVLFMVFDSNNQAAESHRAFAEAAVKANPDVKWRVATMHHDLYGRLSSGRADDAEADLRPIFTSIFDEFGVDLVFLGHSHYYSVSYPLFDGDIVGEYGENNTVTDAQGTIYIVSNSINHPRSVEAAENITPQDGNAIAIQKEGPVYNLVDFSEDSIVINSYEMESDTPFNTVTINKTSNEGGHGDYEEGYFDEPVRLFREFIAFFTELGEGIAAIFKSYFKIS